MTRTDRTAVTNLKEKSKPREIWGGGYTNEAGEQKPPTPRILSPSFHHVPLLDSITSKLLVFKAPSLKGKATAIFAANPRVVIFHFKHNREAVLPRGDPVNWLGEWGRDGWVEHQYENPPEFGNEPSGVRSPGISGMCNLEEQNSKAQWRRGGSA